MSGISSGIGLISGIDIASLIDSLITLESRGKVRLQSRLALLQQQSAAMLDINSRLLNLKTTAGGLRLNSIFDSIIATSSNASLLTATGTGSAQPGTYDFLVKQLVSSSQKLSKGFSNKDSSPLGMTTLSFEIGAGKVSTDTKLADLNGGAGVRRGKIDITDSDSNSATIDLSTATSMDEVLDAINLDTTIEVTATAQGDKLVITDNAGGAGLLTITNATGYFTATDLGIAAIDGGAGDADASADGKITGSQVNLISSFTALSTLNDGNGVLITTANPDLHIETRDAAGADGVFDIDLGRVDKPIDGTTLLEDLNDGAGIAVNADSTEDLKFIDRDGNEHLVDLTGTITVQDFIDRVFDQTDGDITITVHGDGDKFTVTDNTGGSGQLQVLGAGPGASETPEDLGILKSVSASSFDGEVLENADHTPAATTIQEVIDRINNAVDNALNPNAGRIVASIAADGVSLQIDDTTGGGGNLIVTSTATNPYAAADLGVDTGAAGVQASTKTGDRVIAGINSVLLTNLFGGSGVGDLGPELSGGMLLADLLAGAGIDTSGSGATDMRIRDRANNPFVNVDLDAMTTVQDLIDFIDTDSGGNLELVIEGGALRINDLTGSTSFDLRIEDRSGTSAATDLGLEGDHPLSTVLGVDLDPLGTRSFDVTDRDGFSATINLTDPKSLSEIVDAINNAGIGVMASFNDAGNGLLITDTTGGTGNLTITDTAGTLAAGLGIEADVASNTIRGSNLQLQYVSEATLLSSLNYGRGIGTGEIRITDGEGDQFTVTIGTSVTTVFDLVTQINANAGPDVDINARVNDNGDGIVIENTLGTGLIKVESLGGTTAGDLNILGEATADGADIDGSYEKVVTLNSSDTLNEVVQAINDAGIPVTASILNTGVGATPYKIVFSSDITGTAGDLLIDDGGYGLNLTTLNEAQDAEVFFGSDDPAKGLLISRSSNQLDGVLEGISIDLLSADLNESVTVTVTRDTQTIEDAIADFVTTFNDAVGRIDQYDFFSLDTEARGVLLGNSTTASIRSALFRTVQQKAVGVGTQFQFLSQVGITVGANGVLEFDRDKFRTAYTADAEAVDNLFTAFKGSTSTSEEVAPGVTITTNVQTFSSLGFGDVFDQLLDGLTNSIDGTLTIAGETFQTQMDLTEDRIEAFDERLERRRQRLERQFLAMETALARLQGQSNSLLSLANNISFTQSIFG